MDDRERLLNPVFAGYLTPEELAFIKSRLRKSASLRRCWGFRPSAKQLNEDYIRYVAMYGVPKNGMAVLASAENRGKFLLSDSFKTDFSLH